MDYTVLGILQARTREWVAFSFSRGSSQPRDRTQVSRIAGDSLPAEPQGKPPQHTLYLYIMSSGPIIYVKHRFLLLHHFQLAFLLNRRHFEAQESHHCKWELPLLPLQGTPSSSLNIAVSGFEILVSTCQLEQLRALTNDTSSLNCSWLSEIK